MHPHPDSYVLAKVFGAAHCKIESCVHVFTKKPSKNLPTDKGILEVCSWQRVIFYD